MSCLGKQWKIEEQVVEQHTQEIENETKQLGSVCQDDMKGQQGVQERKTE